MSTIIAIASGIIFALNLGVNILSINYGIYSPLYNITRVSLYSIYLYYYHS